MTRNSMRGLLASLVLSGLVLAGIACAQDLSLSFSKPQINPLSETVDIVVTAPQDGQAQVRLFGPDWRPMQQFDFPQVEANTAITQTWDGRGEDGEPLPDEAYFATVEFTQNDGTVTTLDRSVERALGEVLIQDVRYVPDEEAVLFKLSVAARVTILVGIDGGGPLMHTLLSAVPFPPGEHKIPWDGRDQSGVENVADNDRFRLFSSAREIVSPAVILKEGADVAYHQLTRALEAEEIPVKDGVSIEEFGGAAHLLPGPADVSPEPVFTLSVPGAELGSDGIPVVSGKVPLRVSLGDDVRVPVLSRRFEIVLFQNLDFTTEIEEGRSPATIVWDASSLPSGRYLLTVNVATLPGQMSAASTYVDLQQ